MAVVALIPTGVMEHIALAPALSRLFPNDSFIVLPPERQLDGFTSCDVTHLRDTNGKLDSMPLEELAAWLVNAIFHGRRSVRVDFAYVIEDLEPCNQHQPDAVLQTFREAVENCVRSQYPLRHDQSATAVRERCSFHLFRPMTEAYFFGDIDALSRAGAKRPPVLPAEANLELFQSDDSEYRSLPSGSRHVKGMPLREYHPKSYLQFLCDPTLATRRAPYRERTNGKAALESLDWETVLQHPSKCPFLTAFLDDLSQALNVPLPFVNPELADLRVRAFGHQNRILRNI